jgi:hypothetical protein
MCYRALEPIHPEGLTRMPEVLMVRACAAIVALLLLGAHPLSAHGTDNTHRIGYL